MDEALKEFLLESNEFTAQMETDLLELEKGDADPELVNNIFRALHTIKGNSGFLAFEQLESLSHTAEALLVKVRNNELQINTEITSALIEALDAIRVMLEKIEASGTDGGDDHSALKERLTSLG